MPRKRRKQQSRGGCSNTGKYSKGPFCGPVGGACPGTYPVNTPARAIASKSYARFSPNPAGIKACADKHAKKMGWYDYKTGKIKRVSMLGSDFSVSKGRNGRIYVRKD